MIAKISDRCLSHDRKTYHEISAGQPSDDTECGRTQRDAGNIPALGAWSESCFDQTVQVGPIRMNDEGGKARTEDTVDTEWPNAYYEVRNSTTLI